VATPNIKPFAPGVYEMQFVQTYGEDTNVRNRLFFTFTGTMGQTEAGALASNGAAIWQSDLVSQLVSQLVLTEVTVTDLGSAGGSTGVFTTSHAGTGVVSNPLPASTCFMLHGSVNRRYRGGKPRWYQSGGLTTSLADEQTWTTAYVTAFNGAFHSFVSTLAGFATGAVVTTNNVNLSYVDGHTWTVITLPSGQVNYRRDPTYRTAPVEDVIQAWAGQPRIAHQRRRVRFG
jgi:hypothetical protein